MPRTASKMKSSAATTTAEKLTLAISKAGETAANQVKAAVNGTVARAAEAAAARVAQAADIAASNVTRAADEAASRVVRMTDTVIAQIVAVGNDAADKVTKAAEVAAVQVEVRHRELVEQTIDSTFERMGIDITNPKQVRADFEAIRGWRDTMRYIGRRGLAAIVWTVAVGLLGAIGLGISAYLKNPTVIGTVGG